LEGQRKEIDRKLLLIGGEIGIGTDADRCGFGSGI
jgi:hypothetical protein